MKKILAVLLALFVIGGFAFAQITFSGYVRGTTTYDTGLSFAARLRLNMTVTDPDGKYGAWGRLQTSDLSAPSVSYLYGWVKLGSMVKITAGDLGNYDYCLWSGSASDYASTGNVGNDLNLDAQLGLLVQFTPVDGLSLGVVAIPETTLGLGAFSFDASYAIKDVGTIVLTSKLADAVADSFFSASFDLTAVKSLDITAGFKYGAGIGYKAMAAQGMTAFAIVNFDGGAFSAQLAPEFDIVSSEIYAEGYVQYVAGAFTFRGLGAYDSTATVLGTTTWFGGEAAYAVTKKAALNLGVYYGDALTVKADVKVKF